MTLRDLPMGCAFRLNRTGQTFKKIGYRRLACGAVRKGTVICSRCNIGPNCKRTISWHRIHHSSLVTPLEALS